MNNDIKKEMLRDSTFVVSDLLGRQKIDDILGVFMFYYGTDKGIDLMLKLFKTYIVEDIRKENFKKKKKCKQKVSIYE